MASDSLDDQFPFDTYKEYVSALLATDNAYESLRNFFNTSPDDPFGSQVHVETQVPRSGTMVFLDWTTSGKLGINRYSIGGKGSREQVKDCIATLKSPSTGLQTRIVLVSYHRDPFTGQYTGVNTDLVDEIGKTQHIHPETLLWHFGSDLGLDKRFFPFSGPPIPSALSSRNTCHLRHHDSLFSFCLKTSKTQGVNDTTIENTVIIFARNMEFQNWGLLISRLKFLDSTLPLPDVPGGPASRWSSDLFVEALGKLSQENALACAVNPIEYIIPYAQMILISATFVMDTWVRKVMHPRGKTSSNLEVHYDKQLGVLNEVQQNLDALRVLTTEQCSPRWITMISDYERVVKNAEQQINVVLAQKMTYRAAMASLTESRLSIEHAKRGIEQNGRLKKLTQLAFIFIPLSFSTSAFGMNLEILGTGSAKIWMVVVAVLLVYLSTGLLWMLFHYQDTLAALTELCSGRDLFASFRIEKSRKSTV